MFMSEKNSVNTSIQPQLRLLDLTMIVVGLVIGMGIFRTPPEVAQAAHVPWIFFTAWLAGAVVTLIGALTFAEIGSRFPQAGGYYKLFSHCYHPAFAFMVNWIIVISNAASTAGVAIMGTEYILPLVMPDAQDEVWVKIFSALAVMILFLFNWLGIKAGSRLLNLLMFVKITLLVLIISSIFFVDTPVDAISHSLPEGMTWWHALGLCFIPVFFTYGGYQQTMNFGGDVVNPARTFPRAIFIAMMVVMILYFAVNYAYVHALGFSAVQNSKTLAADVTGLIFGDTAHKIVSVLMFFSVMAYVNVSLMSNPRIYYAMAQDGVLPKAMTKINSKTQVQETGLILFTAFIVVTLFFTGSFQRILEYVMFFDSIGFITAAAALFILRRKTKTISENKIFIMFGYPYLPIIFIAGYIMLSVVVLTAEPNVAIYGGLLFISGWPLFYLLRYLVQGRRNVSKS